MWLHDPGRCRAGCGGRRTSCSGGRQVSRSRERGCGGRVGVARETSRPAATATVDRGQGTGYVQEPVRLCAADAELRVAVRLPARLAEGCPDAGGVGIANPGGLKNGEVAPLGNLFRPPLSDLGSWFGERVFWPHPWGCGGRIGDPAARRHGCRRRPRSNCSQRSAGTPGWKGCRGPAHLWRQHQRNWNRLLPPCPDMGAAANLQLTTPPGGHDLDSAETLQLGRTRKPSHPRWLGGGSSKRPSSLSVGA